MFQADDSKPEIKGHLETTQLQQELVVAKLEAACAREERELLETHLETSNSSFWVFGCYPNRPVVCSLVLI